MADMTYVKNVGELIDPKYQFVLSWTAGGGADSASESGVSIDRGNFVGGGMPRSCDVEVYYSAVLGSGHTLSLYLDLQNSSTNSTFTDFATETAAVVATGASGGSTVTGVYRFVNPPTGAPTTSPGIDLNGAQRYVRLLVIPHLSATGTDTAIITGAITFGGFDLLAAAAT
jgi:hypothetical protein